MFALATVGTVVVRIIDVRKGCSLELGVFHVPTLAPVGCGLLLYNSYSLNTRGALYKTIAAGRAWISLGMLWAVEERV